jgi:hypothetical protein
MHDLLHGVFHIERGILFTLKQVVIRPGYSARDYISGKRVSYYNIFYLMVIILGVILFLDTYVETANNILISFWIIMSRYYTWLLYRL